VCPPPPPPPPPAPAEATDALVYTGNLSGAWGRDPEPLLRALVQLEREGSRFRLIHAGGLTTTEQALIEHVGASDLVEHLGTLGRERTHALQRSAKALVLVTSRHASEATGKLFEYLAAGRPIVALAAGNEAARIVRETGTGVAVAPDDGIVRALRRVESGELERAYTARGVERYTYPAPAESVAELIEQAVARHDR
jgi:glycosyltransferase involved in cell wall biosynthesis